MDLLGSVLGPSTFVQHVVLAKWEIIVFLQVGKLRSRVAESGYGSRRVGTRCPGSARPRGGTEGRVQQHNYYMERVIFSQSGGSRFPSAILELFNGFEPTTLT